MPLDLANVLPDVRESRRMEEGLRMQQLPSVRSPRKNKRLLKRGSNQRFSVSPITETWKHGKAEVALHDKFHGLVQMPWPFLLMTVASMYIVSWVIFAVLYHKIDEKCNLSAETFLSAMYFSLITGSTIGYGTNELKFGGCWSALIVIGAQTLLTIFMNSALLGLVYSKFSMASTRASRIIFSEKACVRRLGQDYVFTFQVVDGSCFSFYDDPLIEAHVRVFAVRDSIGDPEDGVIPFQQCVMRLQQPNDELGGTLMLSLPSAVIHRIDAWSPLMPPSAPLGNMLPLALNNIYPAPLLRTVDTESGNRSAHTCDTCGETYETAELLRIHTQYSAASDRISGHDVGTMNPLTGESFCSPAAMAANLAHLVRTKEVKQAQVEEESHHHQEVEWLDQLKHSHRNHFLHAQYHDGDRGAGDPADSDELKTFFRRSKLEVVILVEAIDLSTSNTMQARHSYSYASGDIELDRKHVVPCTSRSSKSGGCIIDLELFHSTVPAPPAPSTRSTPSII